MFITIISFIVVFSLLVLIHEIGHFFAAKKCGAKVEEFGIGYPPRVWGYKKGETIYSINWIPFGGFVKILGENMEEDKKDDSRSFASKSISKRFLMLSAGIIMNFLLAIVLFSIGNAVGLPQQIDENLPSYARIDEASKQIQVLEIVKESPAAEAELMVGDIIKNIKVAGVETMEVYSTEEVRRISDKYQGQEVVAQIERGGELIEKQLTPRVEFPEDEGPMGVALLETAVVSYPWYMSLYRGVIDVYHLTILFIILFYELLKSLVINGKTGMEIAGPVGIAVMTGQVARLGFIYLLQFTAILSINLAIVNALPIPALDGGRLLFLAIEKIKGKPVGQNIENIFHLVGFAFLIILMILITYKDVVRYFF